MDGKRQCRESARELAEDARGNYTRGDQLERMKATGKPGTLDAKTRL